MRRDSKVNRRRFLQATGGTAAAVALSGCFSDDDGGDGNETIPGADDNESDGSGDDNDDDEGGTQEVYQPWSLGVEAEDDYTLRMELEAPFHQVLEMLSYSSFAAVPEGLIGDVEEVDGEMDQSTFASENPIGSGPFQFEDWVPDDAAAVSAYGDYHGEAPDLNGISWEIIEDNNAQYQYSQNRNSDFIAMPTAQYDPSLVNVEETDDLDRDYGTYGPMENGDTANYLRVLSASTQYVGMNVQNVDKPVRQAVAYAMNQERIVSDVFKERGQPAYHLTPPPLFPDGADGYEQHAEEYPYGRGESLLDEARQVMEEAGYGQNEQYELTLTHQEGVGIWQDLAGILQDQLRSAHVNVNVEEAPWSTLLERGRSGNLDMFFLGWLMDYPDPESFMQLLTPEYVNTQNPGPVAYTDWRGTEAADQAQQLWDEVQENLDPTDEAEQTRAELYPQMEEANWEDASIVPIYHPYDERFWYDRVSPPRFGSAGPSRQKHNNTTKDGGDNVLQLINATMTTMDPIEATDTASGTVITQLFDGLMKYPNGEITPEGALAEDYEVSDDFTTYTFQLKEGATFHDGSEVTAQDFVYSFERLAGSENTSRDYFILDNLGVTHETEEVEQ